jgi:hypothetical protein
VVTNNKNNVYDIQFVSAMPMKLYYLDLLLGLCCPVLFRGGRDCFVLQKKSEKAEFLA